MTTSNCFIKFTFCLTVLFVEETRVYIWQLVTVLFVEETEGELDKTVTICQMYTLVSSTNKTARQKVNLIKQLLVVRVLFVEETTV
jgi:hypothetical protein